MITKVVRRSSSFAFYIFISGTCLGFGSVIVFTVVSVKTYFSGPTISKSGQMINSQQVFADLKP